MAFGGFLPAAHIARIREAIAVIPRTD